MSSRRNASVLAGSLLLVSTGCGKLGPVQSAHDAYEKTEQKTIVAAAAASGTQTRCPVTMQLVNKDDDGTRMISEAVCLSLNGDQLAIPGNLKLFVDDTWYRGHYRVCEGDPKDTVPPVAGVKECTWNGRFRHVFPWSIVLRSASDVVGGLPGQIKAVRVFLNGDLVYKWVPRSTDSTPFLTIEGTALRRALLPSDAPMDVRIIPHDVQVNEAALDQNVTARRSQWKAQLAAVKTALAGSPSLANGELEARFACIRYRAESAFYNAAVLAGEAGSEKKSELTAPLKPLEKCPQTPVASPGNFTSLSAGYAGLKSKTVQDLDQLHEQLVSRLKTYAAEAKINDPQALEEFKKQAKDWWNGKGAWWVALDAVQGDGKDRMKERKDLLAFLARYPDANMAKLTGTNGWAAVVGAQVTENVPWWPAEDELAWLRTRGTEAQIEALLVSADAMVTQGLAAIDDTVSLATQLRKDAVRIAGSTDEQARMFLRVAGGLQGTSPFEHTHENPETLPGERALGMRYYDPVQFFFIAPWTGFPMSLDGKADFTAANLTPIIDGAGVRVQWAGSRFADVRAGVGMTGLGFSRPDPADATKTTQEYRFAFEGNVSIANFKLGVAYATGPDLTARDRVRFLLGADLIKLISGSNVEAITQ